ncbi:MAG: hypothetical protein ABNH30_10775, partial [Thalassolituus sp.]
PFFYHFVELRFYKHRTDEAAFSNPQAMSVKLTVNLREELFAQVILPQQMPKPSMIVNGCGRRPARFVT